MKTLVGITAVLASASVAKAGLVSKSDQSANIPNIPMKIGCYPTGNNPAPNALSIKLPTCNGLLNGDNCFRFCKCNEKSEVVCDASDMKGCSNKEMSKVCGQTGEDKDWHGYFYCSCWPA